MRHCGMIYINSPRSKAGEYGASTLQMYGFKDGAVY